MYILVLSADSLRGIRFSILLKAINHLIHSSGQPFLKMINCLEYLDTELVGSIRNSNLMSSVLSTSPPSALSNSLTLETKGVGLVLSKSWRLPNRGSGILNHGEVSIDYQQSVITILYAELNKVKLRSISSIFRLD
jgi:hypothetical protein